jgi:hypothetical protein
LVVLVTEEGARKASKDISRSCSTPLVYGKTEVVDGGGVTVTDDEKQKNDMCTR